MVWRPNIVLRAVLVLLVFMLDANAKTLGPAPRVAGNLGLVVLASLDPNYLSEWANTAQEHPVTITRARKVAPEQTIYVAFVVTGMAPDGENEYSVSVSYELIGPDGEIVFGDEDYANSTGEVPSRPTYIMANPALDIIFDSKDFPGTYLIRAVVTDRTSSEKVEFSYELELQHHEH